MLHRPNFRHGPNLLGRALAFVCFSFFFYIHFEFLVRSTYALRTTLSPLQRYRIVSYRNFIIII